MDYFLEELCRLGTKYALCPEMAEPSLSELKKRFAGFEWCADKATAAAFGYYAAMEEFNGKKTIKKDIYEQCTAVVDDAQKLALNSGEAADRIFTLIYHWLDKELESEEWGTVEDADSFRHDLHRLFENKLIDEKWVEKYQQD